jgi:hypothetical protein
MHMTNLQAFLYVLVREHLPFGAIEKILMDLERNEKPLVPSEKVQARYCETVELRLLKKRRKPNKKHRECVKISKD